MRTIRTPTGGPWCWVCKHDLSNYPSAGWCPSCGHAYNDAPLARERLTVGQRIALLARRGIPRSHARAEAINPARPMSLFSTALTVFIYSGIMVTLFILTVRGFMHR